MANLTDADREALSDAAIFGGSIGWHAEIERILTDRLAEQRREIAKQIEGAIQAGHLMSADERCGLRNAARIARETL